jgi:hypothetical protein
MRKISLAILAALTLPLFTACDDDEKSTAPAPAPTGTLTTQDKQQVAVLAASLGSGGYASLATSYSEMAKGMAQSFASGFAPTGGRALGASCGSFDTTMSEEGMTISMKITKPDGSNFASCEEAGATLQATGAKIVMTMTMSQEGMSMTMKYSMVFKPNAAGGFHMAMTMSMSVSGGQGAQTTAVSIDPVTIVMDQATAESEATMNGTMTITMNGLTVSSLAFTEKGITAGEYSILKSGAKVAKLVISAAGTATVYDLDGNEIKG